MTAKERMLSYLKPGQYDNDKVMQALFQTQGIEIDQLRFALDETLLQLFIPEATWALHLYEEQYGLPVDESLDVEARRSRIMARKRRGRKNGLLRILQAVEPTLSLSWGGAILPFTLHSEKDEYDFGPLIVLLERHKSAHLSYSFQVAPAEPTSGYAVYANHISRNRVALELLAGTAMAGRWPQWSTEGKAFSAAANIKALPIIGKGLYDPSGTLYSGPVRGRENVGVITTGKPTIAATPSTYASPFFYSGLHRSGEIPVVTSSGTAQQAGISTSGQARTGYGPMFPCGVYHCGEEMA